MRVIIIADYAIAEGGAPQVAIASALGLASLGHDVVYIHGIGREGDASLDAHPKITRVALGGKDIWSKSPLAAARDGIWNSEPLAELEKLLAQYAGPDAVAHVHQWTKYFSPSLFSAIRKSGLPLVVSLHDYFLVCPTGLMYRFDKREPCGLAPLSRQCLTAPCDPRSSLHKAVRVMRALAANRAMRDFRYSAIHVSEIGRKTIGHLLSREARQFVLENPIECVDQGLRTTGQDLKIVYCGRLTEEKGADLVARAALAAQLPSLFIGEGPLREKILEIDPTAEITGWLERAAVRGRIARDALAVAAPSRWPETGPMVIAEAMSCGAPVIVSTRAGAAGRVEHGVNGYVVAPRVEELADHMRKLKDKKTAAEIGANAYASFWQSPPSPQAHAKALVEIYRRTIS